MFSGGFHVSVCFCTCSFSSIVWLSLSCCRFLNNVLITSTLLSSCSKPESKIQCRLNFSTENNWWTFCVLYTYMVCVYYSTVWNWTPWLLLWIYITCCTRLSVRKWAPTGTSRKKGKIHRGRPNSLKHDDKTTGRKVQFSCTEKQ